MTSDIERSLWRSPTDVAVIHNVATTRHDGRRPQITSEDGRGRRLRTHGGARSARDLQVRGCLWHAHVGRLTGDTRVRSWPWKCCARERESRIVRSPLATLNPFRVRSVPSFAFRTLWARISVASGSRPDRPDGCGVNAWSRRPDGSSTGCCGRPEPAARDTGLPALVWRATRLQGCSAGPKVVDA